MNATRFDFDSDLLSLDRLWNWARRHPGTLALGAAVLAAALLTSHPKKSSQPSVDAEADETPLFI